MRFRNSAPIGHSFLTRGSDDHDHRGTNKARRRLGPALVAEWLDEGPKVERPQNPTSWRIVVETSVRENYGAHDWDGKGQCPQHWKCKGGSEYHFELGGINEMLVLSQKRIRQIAEAICNKVERNDDYLQEFVYGWSVLSNLDETYEEEMNREMAGWCSIPSSPPPTFTLAELGL